MSGPCDFSIEIRKSQDPSELKPCPFCGNKEILYEKYEHSGTSAMIRWRVWCTKCIACIDPGYAQSRFTVQTMWNRRAKPDVNP